MTDGSTVDPIEDTSGGIHSHQGDDLEPFATLTGAFLARAYLIDADLFRAILTDANLLWADLDSAGLNVVFLTEANLDFATLSRASLASANLTNASLRGASLDDADLAGANLSAADLTSAVGLDLSRGRAFYNANTIFTDTGFDPVAAGWTLLPEPVPSLAMLSSMLVIAGLRRLRASPSSIG